MPSLKLVVQFISVISALGAARGQKFDEIICSVAESAGLSVQQFTSSRREGYCTYTSLPVPTEALSYQSSSTTRAVSYLL